MLVFFAKVAKNPPGLPEGFDVSSGQKIDLCQDAGTSSAGLLFFHYAHCTEFINAFINAFLGCKFVEFGYAV